MILLKFIKNIFDDYDNEIKIEVLSQEILFRIPKFKKRNNMKFNFETFFNKLDNNLKKLKIKSGFKKFYLDLSVLIKKRFKQIYHDSHTFILEIMCAILLILIGLMESSIEYFPDKPNFKLSPSVITKKSNNIIL